MNRAQARRGVTAALLAAALGLLLSAGCAWADLQKTDEWEGAPGSPFAAIGDLTVGPSGTVGVYDPDSGRASIFSADGDFLLSVDGPQGLNGFEDSVGLDLRADGAIEVFDRAAEKLYRFDEEGEPIEQIQFDLPGNVRDFSQDPSGGYIASFGTDLRVARFNPAGEQLVSWPTGRFIDDSLLDGATVEINEHLIDDRVYLASGYVLGMFSRGGEAWANWSLATEACDVTGPGLIDLALDEEGNTYLLASLSETEEKKMLFKLDESMNEVWREATDPDVSEVAVGPDGSIYLAGNGFGVARYTRIEPTVPVNRSCEKPPPPEEKKFELLGVKYGPERTWARIRFQLPEAGQVTVSGPKIMRISRSLSPGRIHAITVRARPKYMRPSRPRRQLKLAVQLTYGNGSAFIREQMTVRLKSRLRRAG